MIDTKLLTDIFSIPATSGGEDEMREFIWNFLAKEQIKFNVDTHGNLFNIDNKNMPLLNSHMDTVAGEDDCKLQKFVKIRDNILSGYGVIGADDKCGIFIILSLLKEMKDLNFLFTIEEEIGCVGAKSFILTRDISHLPYALVLDRYGSSDIICHSNNYGTKEFENALHKLGKEFGYRPERGLVSDADYINEQLSCANLSVGYYEHHTEHEFVKLSELENSLNYVRNITQNLKTKFKAPEVISQSYYSYSTPVHWYDDSEEYISAYNKTNTCFVTGKGNAPLFFLDSVNKYISREGAALLIEEMDLKGIFDEDTFNEEWNKELDSFDSFDSFEEHKEIEEALEEQREIDELLKEFE